MGIVIALALLASVLFLLSRKPTLPPTPIPPTPPPTPTPPAAQNCSFYRITYNAFRRNESGGFAIASEIESLLWSLDQPTALTPSYLLGSGYQMAYQVYCKCITGTPNISLAITSPSGSVRVISPTSALKSATQFPGYSMQEFEGTYCWEAGRYTGKFMLQDGVALVIPILELR